MSVGVDAGEVHPRAPLFLRCLGERGVCSLAAETARALVTTRCLKRFCRCLNMRRMMVPGGGAADGRWGWWASEWCRDKEVLWCVYVPAQTHAAMSTHPGSPVACAAVYRYGAHRWSEVVEQTSRVDGVQTVCTTSGSLLAGVA